MDRSLWERARRGIGCPAGEALGRCRRESSARPGASPALLVGTGAGTLPSPCGLRPREGGAGGGARRARRRPPPTGPGGGGPARSEARAPGLILANKCLWRSPRGPETRSAAPGGPPCAGPGSYGAGGNQGAPGRAAREPPPRPSAQATPAAQRGGRGLGSAARRAGAGSPREQRSGCRRARS